MTHSGPFQPVPFCDFMILSAGIICISLLKVGSLTDIMEVLYFNLVLYEVFCKQKVL